MSPAGRDERRLNELFSSIDARDAERFASFLTEDAMLQFGSAPPVSGRAAIRETIEAFFVNLGGIAHDVEFATCADDRIVCAGQVTYTRLDGSKVILPFADILRVAVPPDERLLISDYRIYMDISPLYRASA